jgi:protein SCO1/2
MMRALLVLLALIASPAWANLTSAQLSAVTATPLAGARLPVGLSFLDQSGHFYRLTQAPMPTVLLFADYSCRHICGPGVTLTAGALHDAGLRAGRDYRMIVIGMDQDGPALARKLATDRLKGLPAEAGRMLLLTGRPATVGQAEHLLGYHAIHDPATDQFAHDAAIYVFSGPGRLSALLPETASTPTQLAAAIAGARQGKAYLPPGLKQGGGSISRISAICYGLAGMHGPYSGLIVLILRIGGLLTCAGLAFVLARFLLRRRPINAA